MTTLPTPAPPIVHGNPLVSVVVPCFREGRYLDDCLWSIRRQTHEHLEVLVIDDAGLDDSVAVALDHARADARIEVLRTDRNVGLGSIRNLGTRHARGDLMQYLDGDDWIPPDSIASRVRAWAQHLGALDGEGGARVAGVFGDWQHTVFNAGLDLPVRPSRTLTAIDLASSRGGNVCIVSAPLVRTDLMRLSGGFAEGVKGAEDHLGWMRLLALDTVLLPTPHFVAFYRQKRSSMLRQSAESFAAFAIAGRSWVDGAVAALRAQGPPPAAPAMARVDKGDVLMLWGRPRRRHTQLAAIGALGERGELPDLVGDPGSTSPPGRAADGPLAELVALGTRFLEDPSFGTPPTSAAHFRRTPLGFVTARVEPAAEPGLARRVPAPVADITIRARGPRQGLDAAAAALRLVAEGTQVALVLDGLATRGALAALCATDVMPEGLQLLDEAPADGSGGRLVDASELDVLEGGGAVGASSPGADLLRSRRRDGSPPATAFVVPARTGDIATYDTWIASAEALATERDLEPHLVTIWAESSRTLADNAHTHARPHEHTHLGRLAEAALVICQDRVTAELASAANDATIVVEAGTQGSEPGT